MSLEALMLRSLDVFAIAAAMLWLGLGVALRVV